MNWANLDRKYSVPIARPFPFCLVWHFLWCTAVIKITSAVIISAIRTLLGNGLFGEMSNPILLFYNDCPCNYHMAILYYKPNNITPDNPEA